MDLKLPEKQHKREMSLWQIILPIFFNYLFILFFIFYHCIQSIFFFNAIGKTKNLQQIIFRYIFGSGLYTEQLLFIYFLLYRVLDY